ncbi:MAG: aminoacyl-tRNA hydrolase [Verrucomicrobiota bacterium]
MDDVNLIVGLGNPGDKYAETRHNVGFLVAEAVAERLRNPTVGKAFHGRWIDGRFAGRAVSVLVPMTFMNRSGDAVAAAVRAGRCEPRRMLVVYDCLDLPFGRIRMRQQGGSGGHRGLQSIIDAVGMSEVPRLRVGIGRPQDAETVDYVLSPWNAEEREGLSVVIDAAAEAALTAVRNGVVASMNQYNRWSLTTPDADNGADPKETELKH